MSSALALELTPSLESVRQEFEHWRKSRTKQGKIPPYLWKEVEMLLKYHAISEVCRTLKINHGQIQDNLKEPIPHSRSTCKIDFAEVSSTTKKLKKPKESKLRSNQNQVDAINQITIKHPGGASLHIEVHSEAMLIAAIQTFIGVHS